MAVEPTEQERRALHGVEVTVPRQKPAARQGDFLHGARRKDVEKGLQSRGGRIQGRGFQCSSESKDSSAELGKDSQDQSQSLLSQLASKTELLVQYGLSRPTCASNADCSDGLQQLRRDAHSGLRARSARKTRRTHGNDISHLPDGLRGLAIHDDVCLAPIKLQQAVYQARRQAQLIKDTRLRKESESVPMQQPDLDMIVCARSTLCTNIWGLGGPGKDNIPRFYKDAEQTALKLSANLAKEAHGPDKTTPLDERLQALDQLCVMNVMKGHPTVMDAVLQSCKSKEHRERVKALKAIPCIFYKGDPTAIGVVIGRLLDYHVEVRRAAVQVLLDSTASLTITIIQGKDLAIPEVQLSLERYEQELAGTCVSPAVPPASDGVVQIPSTSSRAASQGMTQSSGIDRLSSATGIFSRIGSSAFSRARSAIPRTGSTPSRVSRIRPVEKPIIAIYLVCRLESSEADSGTESRISSQPYNRCPRFKYPTGETLRMKVYDPEAAKLVIEVVCDVNGGGPADEKCTFFGLKAHDVPRTSSNGKCNENELQKIRPSTQDAAFENATSAGSMTTNTSSEPPRLTGSLPPCTIILGRAEKMLTDISRQIVKSEQWVQLVDGNGNPAGSVSLKCSLEPAKGIGCSATMGRELAGLCAPALLDADPWIRARALELYQMCMSAGRMKQGKHEQECTQQGKQDNELHGGHSLESKRVNHENEAAQDALLRLKQGVTGKESGNRDCDDKTTNAKVHIVGSTSSGKDDVMNQGTSFSERAPRAGDFARIAVVENDNENSQPSTTYQSRPSTRCGVRLWTTEDNAISSQPSITVGVRFREEELDEDMEAAKVCPQPAFIMHEQEPKVQKASLEEEHILLDRKRAANEAESKLKASDLDALIGILLDGLCDLDSGVRWTAVDLLSVVLRRENDLGNLGISVRVLNVAVPLAVMSFDEDARVAAINAMYSAGKACRSWTAQHLDGHLAAQLHQRDMRCHVNRQRQYVRKLFLAPDHHDIEGWSLRDVLEDRLDDPNWMVRRSAVLAYSMLADVGDLDALHNVLPLLSDNVSFVRCAAVRATEAIVGSPFLIQDQKPTELQIQIVKAIIDGVLKVPAPDNDPLFNPKFMEESSCELMREVRLKEKDSDLAHYKLELGARMALLFSSGCMKFSGWDSLEHQKWSHLKSWVHNQWRHICEENEIQKQLQAEHERAINNKYTQQYLAEMAAGIEEVQALTQRHMAALHVSALERAARHAATRMQSRWRGIKGRQMATEKKMEHFSRVATAELNAGIEAERYANLSPVEKLLEHIEFSGAGFRNQIMQLQPMTIQLNSDAFPISMSGREATPLKSDSAEALPSEGLRLHGKISFKGEEILQEGEQDSPNAPCRRGISVPALIRKGFPETKLSPPQPAKKAVWDPLASKRSMLPPRKPATTLSEQMQALEGMALSDEDANEKFLQWEKAQSKRKELDEEQQRDRAIWACRRHLKCSSSRLPARRASVSEAKRGKNAGLP